MLDIKGWVSSSNFEVIQFTKRNIQTNEFDIDDLSDLSLVKVVAVKGEEVRTITSSSGIVQLGSLGAGEIKIKFGEWLTKGDWTVHVVTFKPEWPSGYVWPKFKLKMKELRT